MCWIGDTGRMVAYGIHCRRTASREGELELELELSALEWLQLASSRLRASLQHMKRLC